MPLPSQVRRKSIGNSPEEAGLGRKTVWPTSKQKKTFQGPGEGGPAFWWGSVSQSWYHGHFCVGTALSILGCSAPTRGHSTTTNVMTTINISGHCRMSSRGKIIPAETTVVGRGLLPMRKAVEGVEGFLSYTPQGWSVDLCQELGPCGTRRENDGRKLVERNGCQMRHPELQECPDTSPAMTPISSLKVYEAPVMAGPLVEKEKAELSNWVRSRVELQPRGPRSLNNDKEEEERHRNQGPEGLCRTWNWCFTSVKFYLNF